MSRHIMELPWDEMTKVYVSNIYHTQLLAHGADYEPVPRERTAFLLLYVARYERGTTMRPGDAKSNQGNLVHPLRRYVLTNRGYQNA